MQLTDRILVPEHMDDPDIDREELGRALNALARMNHLLGGVRSVLREFARWRRVHEWNDGETIRVIDIGTGSADIPVALVEWGRRLGHRIEVIGIDLHAKTFEFALQRAEPYDEITIVRADARRLMDDFHANSFDYAHAGLFLHHLEDLDVLTVLRIMQRLSRRGLIWNDLVRSWFTKAGIRTFAWSMPEVFRHDSLASINAGFTRAEALDLAGRVGLEEVGYRTILMHRFILTSDRTA